MAKSRDSYRVSRTNAIKFGVSVKGPITCPGRERCRYRYCDDYSLEPTAGDHCDWELTYAADLEAAYRRKYDVPLVREAMPDLDVVIASLVANALRRNRVSFRANQAWSLVRTPLRFWAEFKLCNRYLGSCLRELDQLTERLDRMSAQANVGRLRSG